MKRNILIAGMLTASVAGIPFSVSAAFVKGSAPLHAPASASRHQSAPCHAPAPLYDTPVEDAPEGTAMVMQRSSLSLEAYFGLLSYAPDAGLVVNRVDAPDGRIWLDNPFSGYNLHSFIYGEVEGDVLSVPVGQPVAWDYNVNTDREEPMYVVAGQFVDDEIGGWVFPLDQATIDFRISDNGLTPLNPTVCFALCFWDSETEAYVWNDYADQNPDYTFNRSVPVEPCAGEAEEWAMITPDGNGYAVNVVYGDGEMYVQGMYDVLPGSWVRLNVEGSSAELLPGQFLGIGDSWHYSYAASGNVESYWDDWYQADIDVVTLTDRLVFDYDAERKVLDGRGQSFVIATSEVPVRATDYFNNPYLHLQDRRAGVPPANPYGLSTWYDDWYEYGSFDFYLPRVDVDGNLLDVDRLYYRIFIDGELWTLERSEYPSLPEESMSLIPWTLDDNWDFYTVGVAHSVVYDFEGFEHFGVQSVYIDPESGEEVCSAIVTDEGDGVAEVEEGEVVSERFYDLQGRKLREPEGLCIRVVRYSDGTSKSSIIRP